MVYILRRKNELNINRIAFGYSLDSRLIPTEEGGNSPLFLSICMKRGEGGLYLPVFCMYLLARGEKGGKYRGI